ncbi:dephospho-CoA kinase [Lutibacter oricola]|uniref:Dephospho-CoA kinase n=1 Tax=Lutibacter oricola TaxID=762486 RepID=A0A1H2W968_9FLAO|nr:dephospho-CoA kinase [Lutibacter oricola]SDW77182.1 dephospho-CoA kinase [Lutibacter oricola]
MIVGLTGGIGSGKSTVLELFVKLGAIPFIADIEAKQLMVLNLELVEQIKLLFGEDAYKNGKLNRAYIASIVFNDKSKLSRLNKLVHPKVREHFNEFVKNNAGKIIIYEAAILFESGSNELCDSIITVIADKDIRIKRILKRDSITKEEIESRMKNQLNDEEKVLKSNFVIKNHSLEATKQQVSVIFDVLVKMNIS